MIYKADSPDSIHEIKDVEGHITRINRAVQNVFSSLDPDDNFPRMNSSATKRQGTILLYSI